MTIAEILRQQRVLVPERTALTLLGIPNNKDNREWLARALRPEFVEVPKLTRCYRRGDVKRLRENLAQLARQLPPHPGA